MRLASVGVLLFSALAASAHFVQPNATELSDLMSELAMLPTCATTCTATGLTKTTCDITDFACLCSDEPYISFSETCILSNCTIRQALAAQAWQKKACQAPVRNTGPLTERIGLALIIIATIVLALRFLARWRIQNSSIGWDDWIILLAYLLLLPSTVFVRIMVHHGLGRDIWTVQPSGITLILKLFYVEQYIYQLVIVLTKISIVLLYLRIFPKEVSRRFQYISWTIIAALCAYALGFIIYFAVECKPTSYFWHQWDGEQEGKCIGTEAGIYASSAINIFFDLVVIFLPIPKLMKLQVKDKRRKIGVVLTFLVGLFVTICSIIRLRYLAAFGKVANATYHYNDIGLWSGLEGDVGVICACMPTVAGPLLYFFREKVGPKLSSYTKSYTMGTGKSMNSSRITSDKSITRLPSSASVRDVELDGRAPHAKHGGIEKTTVTSLYNLPNQHASDDDVELMHHNRGPRTKNGWEA